jgi:hypothetical protein
MFGSIWPVLRFGEIAMRVAVVGNGDIEPRYSDYIDGFDFVVRFNACRTYGISGKKVDALCLVNTTDANHFALAPSGIHEGADAATRLFWLARAPNIISHERARCIRLDSELASTWRDHTKDLVEKRIRGRAYEFVPEETYRVVEFELRKRGATNFHQPSTGVLGLAHAILTLRPTELVLFGFTHEGWKWHPWEAERNLVEFWELTRVSPELVEKSLLAAKALDTPVRVASSR